MERKRKRIDPWLRSRPFDQLDRSEKLDRILDIAREKAEHDWYAGTWLSAEMMRELLSRIRST